MASSSMSDALRAPQQVIQSLFDANDRRVDDAFESNVVAHFKQLLAGQEGQIPSLHSLHRDAPVGSLIRFRCMVQDSVGDDVYAATNGDGSKCTVWAEPNVAEMGDVTDFSRFRQRQMLYCTEVPSETEWAKESWYPGRDLAASLSNLDLDDTSTTGKAHATALSRKFPLGQRPHLASLVKLTGTDEPPKPTEIIDVIGIYEQSAWSPTSSIDPNDEEADAPASVPCIYSLYWRPAPSTPSLPNAGDWSASRDALLAYLASGLEGDVEAAEWLLLHLFSRTYSRRAALALGNFPLNLSLPTATLPPLAPILSSLLPLFHTLPLSLAKLNDPLEPFYAPRSVNENLEAGVLQLPAGTHLLVDETEMKEGTLGDKGVRNVKALTTVIGEQKLDYVFPFTEFAFPVDLPVLVVSHGKTFLPVSCVVSVRRSTAPASVGRPSEAQLGTWRAGIQQLKHAEFSIPEEMIKLIESDFVKARQASSTFSQEDLSLRMTAARLMALSMGKTTLDEAAWRRTCELDERRRALGAPANGVGKQ